MMIFKILIFIKKRWLRYIYPHISKDAWICRNVEVLNPSNLYMEENTNISPHAVIMNTRSKFILKKGSGAASGLVVSPGNHMSIPGLFFKDVTDEIKDKVDNYKEFDKDVIVEEDVWIAANVTLLSGVIVGRGAIVGAGAVVRKRVPPYSLVVGNPAKVVGFRFTPEEIVEHEKALYSEKDRLPIEILERNYNNYYLRRIKEIKDYLKQ